MATDYDAPRRRADDEIETDSLEGLKAAERDSIDADEEVGLVDTYDPAVADLAPEDIKVDVVPRRANEFTCGSCFLVQRNNRLDHVEDDGTMICQDCA